MAIKKPVCQYAGELKELQAGDALPVSGQIFAVTAVFDGGTEAAAAGAVCCVRIPRAGTIVKATLLADQAGAAVVDVWKDSYANYPPTDADSITAAAPPTLAAAIKAEDAVLTGWTTALAAGDVLAFHLDACTTIRQLTVILEVTAA